MQIKDLKPRMGVEEIELEIVSKGEEREFANANGSGKVCSCAAKDSDGNEISVTLWNEQCSQIKEGNKIKITNGWTSEFQGQIQISTGKMGKLDIVE
ncbi:MAG: hypothetical protein PHP82_03980 [Candidatus ainarchaeum sp.]|nr:hypothetical protein [Candidatus ainarchaeum sp.]